MNLTKNFSLEEMACRCGCGAAFIKPSFLTRLQALRDEFNKKMVVTSGARCQNYNKKIKGEDNSFHISSPNKEACAVDIALTTSGDRFRFIQLAIKHGFTGIGVDRAFIHIDDGHDVPVMWLYP